MNKKVLMTVLIAGCFLSTLNQTLLNVALSNLMEVFDILPTTVQWLSTGFMLVNGMLIPVSAYLMKRFSTRQLFVSSMGFLLVGSIICAVAPSFGLLLAGRMIQAAGAGIIMPLMMSVVMFIYPVEKRGSAMGIIGLAIIFAPAIAPTLAGVVIEYLSWRWLFIGLIPIVTILIILSLKYLINVSEGQAAKLDVMSVIYSSFGFGSILYGCSSAGSHGWDHPLVLSTLIIGVIISTVFCLRQLGSADPLLDLSVFKVRTFTLTTLLNILITIIMYADMLLLPMYLQDSRGFTALDAGLLLLPGALVNAFLSPITGNLYDRIGAKPLFIIGLLFVIPATFVLTHLDASTSFVFLIVRTIVLRIGFSFITMPLNTSGLNALPRQLITHGTAVNNTVRQLAGSIGTAFVITYFAAQTTKHTLELKASVALDKLKMLASIKGTNDAYVLMFILTIVAVIVVFFLPKQPREAKQPSKGY